MVKAEGNGSIRECGPLERQNKVDGDKPPTNLRLGRSAPRRHRKCKFLVAVRENYFLAAFFTADVAATGFATALAATGFATAAFFAAFGAVALGAEVLGAAALTAPFLASLGFLVGGATFLVAFFLTAFSITGLALAIFLEALPPKIPFQPSEYFSFVPTRVIVTESPFNQN